MRKLKDNLLIYFEFSIFGGAEQYIVYLIEALYSKYNVFIACSGSESYADFFENNYLIEKAFFNPISFKPINKDYSNIHGIDELNAWIDSVFDIVSPKIIIANNGGYPWNISCLFVLMRAFTKEIPNRILILHSTPDDVHYVNGINIDDMVSKTVSAIIFGCHKLMECYKSRKFLDHSLFKVCNYGVPDMDTCSVSNKASRKNIKVGFLGSMRNLRKGQMQILKAAQITKHDEIEYLFAGNGEKLHELELFKNENKLDNVRFLGHLNGTEKSRFFSDIDIFILASEQEGLSLALLEALSSGCAIIATDVGGISEAVYDGINGCLLDESSSVNIAYQIRKLAHKPSLLDTFRKNSRQIYKTCFDYQLFKRRLNSLVDGLRTNKTHDESFTIPFASMTDTLNISHDNVENFIKSDGFPILVGNVLEIELSSRCQFSCRICPRDSIGSSRGFGIMDMSTFLSILENFIDEHIGCIYLCGMGEPTMHPDWVAMCHELKIECNCKLILCTNGKKLPSIKQIELSGIDRLEMSLHQFDSYDEPSIECFNHATSVIENLSKLKKEIFQNNLAVEISVGIVKHKLSENYIEKLTSYASQSGLEIVAWNLWNRANNISVENLRQHHDFSYNLNPCMCVEYGESVFIDWRGNILSCCCDAKNKNIEGNVFSDDIDSIRLKKAYRLSLNQPLFLTCKNCDSPKTNKIFKQTNYFNRYLEVMK